MVLSKKNANAMVFVEPYLVTRVLSVVPSIVRSISFASLRGMSKFDTPLHITSFISIVNIVLHSMLTFKYNLGVKGVAVSTLMSEHTSSIIYLRMLKKRNMIFFLPKSFQIPNWKNVSPLIKGDAVLQFRNLSMNVAFACISRVVQS